MYSQATVSAVLVVTGRLVNSVFSELVPDLAPGLVHVETWLQLEYLYSQPTVRAVLRQEEKSYPNPCGWGRSTELVGVSEKCLIQRRLVGAPALRGELSEAERVPAGVHRH